MVNSVKVKYYDPSGKSHEGYIIDNKTYKDSGGTQRIDLGSVVETADGVYTLTKNGGVKNGTESKYSKMASQSLSTAKKNARNAIETAFAQQSAIIQNNKNQTKKQYAQLAKQLNQKKKLSERSMAQILEAQGIKGGMSESSVIENNVNYENNINDLNIALEKELADYDNELLSLQKDAQYNILMSDSKYDELYADYLRENAKMEFEDYISERNLNAQNFISNRNYDLNSEEFAYRMENDLRNYLRSAEESDRDYERRVLESDRNYGLDEKSFNHKVYNDDRNYALNEKSYNHRVSNDNRNYALNVRKTNISEKKKSK